MDDQKLKSLVEAEREWIIAKRRELHRVPENGFEENRWIECAPGIHHFISRDEAVAYEL